MPKPNFVPEGRIRLGLNYDKCSHTLLSYELIGGVNTHVGVGLVPATGSQKSRDLAGIFPLDYSHE